MAMIDGSGHDSRAISGAVVLPGGGMHRSIEINGLRAGGTLIGSDKYRRYPAELSHLDRRHVGGIMAAMTALRFRWSRTWPDDPHARDDFHVSKDQLGHGDESIRISRVNGGPKGDTWAWAAHRVVDDPACRRLTSQAGNEPSRDEAAAMAERWYFGEIEDAPRRV